MDEIRLGDCLDVLRTQPSDSVDAIVSDPPYGLGTREPSPEQLAAYLQGASLDTGGDFMGKEWEIPSVAIWQQCYRVLRPGRHILAFAGTRTWDIMLAGLEAAGFVRNGALGEPFGQPVLAWMHGQGFPKSLNIAKAIDKHLGQASRVVATETRYNEPSGIVGLGRERTLIERDITVPTSEEAKRWEGWGTALKPAWEPVIALRKPGPILPVRGLVLPFLYCPKVTRSEADAGIDPRLSALGLSDLERNVHPTRKPVKLMKWLINAVARSGELVLDPFCGSGSTGVAAVDIGCDFLGIERDEIYHKIALKRLEHANASTMANARNIFEMLMEMDD
jgi:DNA modification methylase